MNVTHLNQSEKTTSKPATDETNDFLLQAFILLGFVSIIFAAVPEVDLLVSQFFWNAGAGFELNNNSALIAFRDVNRFLPWAVIGIAAVLLIPNPFSRSFKQPFAPHKLLFVITFFAAGPGLSVHLIKMLVARARPRALQEFGGNAFFTPPWEFTNQCARNCSFISGESASAFALLTLVVFVKPKYSIVYLVAIGVLAAAFSFTRVLHGAHFLSDVIIAWNVMLVLAVLLWRIFSRNAPQIDAIFSAK
ncbi:MAG TPA: phosphatase PAP2 family protein [Pararhizobium sp.]|uniref:phosphatase PAP2 family protein n=1 Tax=Pararhizobium sp. TaxID=1977563 RepID=UPI002CDA5988|nr:phosphatase PAP2 family protein [Pararhizobium sp.]HTO30902.1 phosphatase PAP2 family protein [Pararhizobium sp.]